MDNVNVMYVVRFNACKQESDKTLTMWSLYEQRQLYFACTMKIRPIPCIRVISDDGTLFIDTKKPSVLIVDATQTLSEFQGGK